MRPELEAALAANSDAKYSNSKVARARRRVLRACVREVFGHPFLEAAPRPLQFFLKPPSPQSQ